MWYICDTKLLEQYQHILIQDPLGNLHEDEAIEEALRRIDYKLQLLLHGKPNE